VVLPTILLVVVVARKVKWRFGFSKPLVEAEVGFLDTSS
jgi:hypothetical protein